MVRFAKIQSRCLNLLLPCALLFAAGCYEKLPEQAESRPLARNIQVIRPASVAGLQAFFQALDYDWDRLDHEIPPIVLEKFPEDFNTRLSKEQRKQTFLMSLLPMVLLANQAIEEERRTMLTLLERFQGTHTLTPEQSQWLRQLSRDYGLRGDPLTDHRTRSLLLRRVDTIPPSLALAQAANESAWGTSRFVREGNNLFGQWTFAPGTGIVPKDRPAGATYEVRRFKNLNASIRSYFKNLNTHSAYRGLRLTRQKLREQGLPVTGKALAQGLSLYSARGEEYIREIRAMIDQNKLTQLNRIALGYAAPQATEAIGPAGSGLLTSRYQVSGQAATAADRPISD